MELVHVPENPLPEGSAVTTVEVGRVHLRVASWVPSPTDLGTCKGTVVVLPGRSEFIEKYAEVVADLRRRGFAVVVIDWRGQGGSSRLLRDPRRGYVRHFDDYRADLEAVEAALLKPHCPRPFFALAHSMGGAIAMDYASRGGRSFDRIVLSAPMLDIFGLRVPRTARMLAATLTGMGRGSTYIPGGSGRSWMTQPFEGNGLTSDRRRYGAFSALAKAAPDLLIGAPTFGWLHAAFRAMDRLGQDGALSTITTPILAVACGADRVVDTVATERLLHRVKQGGTIIVPHALHEVLMERDAFRSQFWAAFDAFIPGSPAPAGLAAVRN